MTQFPLYRRLGGLPGRSERVREVFSYRDSIPGPSSLWRVAIPRWSKKYYYEKVVGNTFIEAYTKCVHAARNVDSILRLLTFQPFCSLQYIVCLLLCIKVGDGLSIGICWVWAVWFCLAWYSYFFAWPLRGFVLKLAFVLNIYRRFLCPPLRWPDDTDNSYVILSWKVRPSHLVSS